MQHSVTCLACAHDTCRYADKEGKYSVVCLSPLSTALQAVQGFTGTTVVVRTRCTMHHAAAMSAANSDTQARDACSRL
jgi:hypothetical protein